MPTFRTNRDVTPFRTNRETIGWTIQHLANRLGVNERTVRRWDAGEFEAPPTILAWLARLANYHQHTRAPVGARKGVDGPSRDV